MLRKAFVATGRKLGKSVHGITISFQTTRKEKKEKKGRGIYSIGVKQFKYGYKCMG